MDKHPEIQRAIEIAGSQPKLAELSGISQQHISKLLRRERSVSADVALALERATAGQVQRWHLRPDYWSPKERSSCPAGAPEYRPAATQVGTA